MLGLVPSIHTFVSAALAAATSGRRRMTPFDWKFPYHSQRMPVLARNVVATSQPLAAQAGLSMLMIGCNAVDAALSTSNKLYVAEPTGNRVSSESVTSL